MSILIKFFWDKFLLVKYLLLKYLIKPRVIIYTIGDETTSTQSDW